MPRRAASAVAFAALLALTACGNGGTSGGDTPRVVAGLYPLAFVAENVGGTHVRVETAIKPGAEPHDVELSPAQVARIEDADLVLVLGGFQPALDDAVKDRPAKSVLDAARLLDMDTAGHHDDAGTEPDEHSDEHGEDHGDPHFWLDPTLLATYADGVAKRLADIDPPHAADYLAAAAALRSRLDALDREFQAGLRGCDRTELVTSHEAFGFLAKRYGLTQVGIAGLSPDAEPSPRRINEVMAYVREHGVTTIYFETLVSPKVARTIADETGARTALLEPVEAITGDGDDYFSVMRRNLAALRAGLGCP